MPSIRLLFKTRRSTRLSFIPSAPFAGKRAFSTSRAFASRIAALFSSICTATAESALSFAARFSAASFI
jgi:hypothetical protein